jgi:type I restriction-modification system DNA methylase subunit
MTTIEQLTQRFSDGLSEFKNPSYNETQVRNDFIDPLFTLLGWDVGNHQARAQWLRDVRVEKYAQSDSGRPDYSFWIDNERQFFVEAKKPAENLESNPKHAFQLRSYGWSAGLPLSILTDFEELIVYDCSIRPYATDRAVRGRILHFKFEDYRRRWDELLSLLGREAVKKGSVFEFLGSKKRRGTTAIDAAFLSDLESWREELARDIAANNTIERRDLSQVVQAIINRVVFLRISEDRGYEPMGQLRDINQQADPYRALVQLFRNADSKYNSGLFHISRVSAADMLFDQVTERISVSPSTIQAFTTRLYYPDSPYQFSVIPADILGKIYEEFLGRRIVVNDGQISTEQKPEVRKQGGVWYTPSFITEYMVGITLGRQLEGLTPESSSRIRVVDPACGSGSFLITAYQYLLDWHLQYYVAHPLKKYSKEKRIYQDPEGIVHLSIGEKKRILINSIFGVDLDPQAVEVSKLSLLLKVLEDEKPSGAIQVSAFDARVLPDLDRNIRTGNSLVDIDIFNSLSLLSINEQDRERVNPFDWEGAFPEVFADGGFDVVIGNPPYIFGEYLDPNTKTYLSQNYAASGSQMDTYLLFMEKSVGIAGPSSSISMIIPDAILARDDACQVRGVLLEHGLESIYHCGLVFGSSVSAAVLTLNKKENARPISAYIRNRSNHAIHLHDCSRKRFLDEPLNRYLIHASDQEEEILQKMFSDSRPLGEYVSISRGEETGKNSLQRGKIPILVGEDISRYALSEPSRMISGLRKSSNTYQGPKIVMVKTGVRCIAALDRSSSATMQSVYNIHLKPGNNRLALEAILALLNSMLSDFWILKTFTAYKLLFPQMNQNTVLSIPVPAAIGQYSDELTGHVDAIQEALAQLKSCKNMTTKDDVKSEIYGRARLVDRILSACYGLDSKEVSLIKASVAPR